MRSRLAITLGTATLALVAGLGMSAAVAAPSPSPSITTLDGIEIQTQDAITSPEELEEFLLSDTPKTVQVERATGEITEVREGLPIQPLAVTEYATCGNGRACLVAARIPLRDYGFTGSGTKTGTWPERIEWRTGSYTGKAWYRWNGSDVGFGPTMGPNSSVRLDGPATGVKVTLS